MSYSLSSLARLVAVAVTVFLATGGCKRDELPAPRTSGGTMMACKINGKNWVLQPDIGLWSRNLLTIQGLPPMVDSLRYPFRNLSIYAVDRGSTRELKFNLNKVFAKDLFKCNIPVRCQDISCNRIDSDQHYMSLLIDDNTPNRKVFLTGLNELGEMRITHINVIEPGTPENTGWERIVEIAGTFSFKAKAVSSNEVVHITDGRFFYNSRD